MWIDNTGVAPIYNDSYRLAFRFSQGKKSIIAQSNEDLTKWLPGDTWIKEELKLKERFKKGKVNIETALVDAATNEPKVRLAIKSKNTDGWYPLDTIDVK